jgi:hypothetical protein
MTDDVPVKMPKWFPKYKKEITNTSLICITISTAIAFFYLGLRVECNILGGDYVPDYFLGKCRAIDYEVLNNWTQVIEIKGTPPPILNINWSGINET